MNRIKLSRNLEEWESTGFYIDATPYGHKSFVIDIGDKQAQSKDTLLLLHGFPESSFSYSDALPLLLNRFKRVLMFDFIGFGFSDKPQENFTYSIFEQTDVAMTVWKKMGISGGHVLSHDMGDSVLTELLARINENEPTWFKDGFKSVVFTNGGLVRSLGKLRIGQKILLSPLGKGLCQVLENYPIFRHQVNSANGNKQMSEQKIKDMYEAVTYNSHPTLLYKLISYQHERLRFENSRWLPAISSVKVPMLISWGADDKVCPPSVAKYVKDKINPQASLSINKGLGHFCQIQDSQKWVAPLIDFWSQERS